MFSFPMVSSIDPSINNFGNSSGSESEHLTAATPSPFFSSTMATNINKITTPAANDNQNQSLARPRSASPSKPSQNHLSTSHPSSLTSKSQRSINKSNHAYFASSEEESEAELDEKDSHSSAGRRASHETYVPMVSIVAGSESRLAEIASKVSHHSPPPLHSSRVRMSIPQQINRHNDSTTTHLPHHRKNSSIGGVNSNTPIASIYKTAIRGKTVPPPPKTVTVAGGKNSSISDPPPSSHHTLQHPSKLRRRASADKNPRNSLPTYTAPPTRRKHRCKKNQQQQNHLPHGLPVFKDPRSCMWTSTYDANAPSEDRYSSLVNVLLRPPKTPRRAKKKKEQNGNKNNNAENIEISNNGAAVSGKGSIGNNADSAEQQFEAMGAAVGGAHQSAYKNNTASSPFTNINTKNEEEKEEQKEEEEEDGTSLIRLSLWSVIDGHGGGCVATYAAEVLLPHIAASVARALKSKIVDRGVCNVNGQLRDANALDLDSLIRSSDRSRHVGKSQVRQRKAGIDVVNPNSIHYRSPFEGSESEEDGHGVMEEDHVSNGTQDHFCTMHHHCSSRPAEAGTASDIGGMRSESESEAESEAGHVSVASSVLPGINHPITHNMESVTSSVKTSIKTAISPTTQHAPVGTHSPTEVASITRAITDSFLAVDDGWINSIDPITTHQTSCVSNGRWNAGACALVVFTVQRLDWCRSSRAVDDRRHLRESGASGSSRHGLGGVFSFEDTSHNKDAARRRKLDYAGKKCKSVSSLSTLSVLSSTSSITTEANLDTSDILVEESEITETEDDDEKILHHHSDPLHPDGDGFCIAPPAFCKYHYYRPHDAMLYTAHVGDCRAVMLGSAPPRTIKVPPDGNEMHHNDKMSLSLDHSDRSEDESESIADEISSTEGHIDSDSSDAEDMFLGGSGKRRSISRSSRGRALPGGTVPEGTPTMLGFVRRGSSKRQRRNNSLPFVPLPPLNRWSSEESVTESDDSASTTVQDNGRYLPPVSIVGRGAVVGRGVRIDAGVGSSVGSNEPLETEDEIEEAEEEDEIKEIRSVRSGSPTQMNRPPSPTQLVVDPVHPPPLPLSMLMRPIDLTTDHTAYNPNEVTAVIRRCNNAPKAISSASSGGIKRVAGSLAVTRALVSCVRICLAFYFVLFVVILLNTFLIFFHAPFCSLLPPRAMPTSKHRTYHSFRTNVMLLTLLGGPRLIVVF